MEFYRQQEGQWSHLQLEMRIVRWWIPIIELWFLQKNLHTLSNGCLLRKRNLRDSITDLPIKRCGHYVMQYLLNLFFITPGGRIMWPSTRSLPMQLERSSEGKKMVLFGLTIII